MRINEVKTHSWDYNYNPHWTALLDSRPTLNPPRHVSHTHSTPGTGILWGLLKLLANGIFPVLLAHILKNFGKDCFLEWGKMCVRVCVCVGECIDVHMHVWINIFIFYYPEFQFQLWKRFVIHVYKDTSSALLFSFLCLANRFAQLFQKLSPCHGGQHLLKWTVVMIQEVTLEFPSLLSELLKYKKFCSKT